MPVFVNDTEITDEEVFAEMQYHPAPSAEAARETAAQALVVRELLFQKAQKSGLCDTLANDEQRDQAIFNLIESEVTAPEATTDICKHYYDANLDRFKDAEDASRLVPFDAVADKIRDYLHTRSVREGVRAYVLDLAEEARVSGFDLAGSL